MRGSSMRKKLCHVSPSISSLSVVARRKNGGLLYFEANPHHSFVPRSLNGEKSIQRLQFNHVTSYFALGFVLIFFHVLLA
jgi:hypothetical protein